jgi:O-methyltransferase involved in polyketide biosynthesis
MDTDLPEDNHSNDAEATSATRKAESNPNSVAKTLLTTLVARARDPTAAQPVLHDPSPRMFWNGWTSIPVSWL